MFSFQSSHLASVIKFLLSQEEKSFYVKALLCHWVDIIERLRRSSTRFLFLCRFDEQRLTLRIHRGRGSVHNGSNNGNSRSPDSSSRSSVKREKIKISVSYPSTETLNTKCNTLERTPSRCSQMSVHYSNGQTQTQLCPRNTHLKVNYIWTQVTFADPPKRSD